MPASGYCSTPTLAGRHKRRFRSAAEARRTAILMRGGNLHHLAGHAYRVYGPCVHCAGYHLTGRPLSNGPSLRENVA